MNKGFDEIKLGEGKRDHSGEELFVTELQLKCLFTSPLHRVPLPELRTFHLSRRHLPSLTNKPKLSSTITKRQGYVLCSLKDLRV